MTTRRNITGIPEDLKAYLAEEHPSEQRALTNVWDTCGDVLLPVSVDSGRKAEIRSRVLAGATSDRVPRESVRVFRLKSYAMAAVVVVLIGLSFILSPTVRTYEAPLGSTEPVAFQFPDGSSIALAAGSRVSFTSDFGADLRRVTLKGEAFFDIASDEMPFVIDTYNARTSVVGTRFSVRAWPDELDATTSVRVASGIVEVASRSLRDSMVQLQAGEAVAVVTRTPLPATPSSIDPNASFLWTTGGYEYRNVPTGNVLKDLERRFDLLIEASDEVRLRPISIFNQSEGSLEEILGDISATIGVRFRRISGGYELYSEQGT